MENISEAKFKPGKIDQDFISTDVLVETENSQLLDDSINNSRMGLKTTDSCAINDGIIKSDEIFQLRGHYAINSLAGVYFQGVQYVDFKNVNFINNTGIANLIDILKDSLKQGIEVKFVNVKDDIKNKFNSMSLDSIFHFS